MLTAAATAPAGGVVGSSTGPPWDRFRFTDVMLLSILDKRRHAHVGRGAGDTAGPLSLPAGDGAKEAVFGVAPERPADRAATVAGVAVSTDTMVTVANAATLRADDLRQGSARGPVKSGEPSGVRPRAFAVAPAASARRVEIETTGAMIRGWLGRHPQAETRVCAVFSEQHPAKNERSRHLQ